MAWALCAPSVTNMHMFNCARKRFDSKPRDRKREREKDRGRNERVALLTNLLFDFCISVFDIFNSSSSSSHRNNSKMAKDLSTLGWDYFMFAAFIALTVLGPLWTRLFGKTKQRSKADYVFATGGVSIVAVMISIARGTLGVRSVLGKFRTLPLSLSHIYFYIFSSHELQAIPVNFTIAARPCGRLCTAWWAPIPLSASCLCRSTSIWESPPSISTSI